MRQSQAKRNKQIFNEYQEITDPKKIDQISRSYQSLLGELDSMGFNKIHYMKEQSPSFGLVSYFPIILIMLINGEVLSLCKKLSFCTFYPVVIVKEYGSFIELSAGLGSKFFSNFDDGTWVISTKPPLSNTYNKLGKNIDFCTYPSDLPLTSAWEIHKNRFTKPENKDKQINKEIDFEDYISWSYHIDIANKQSTKSFGGLWLYFLSIMLSLVFILVINFIYPNSPDWIRIFLMMIFFLLPPLVFLWDKKK